MLLLAWRTSPEIVGTYAWGILAYTFVGAITDSTMRQIVVSALKSGSGLRFVRKYQRRVMILGPIVLGAVVMALWLTAEDRNKSAALSLLPLVLGPSVLAWNILNVGVLQTAHKWRLLATGQVVASLTAMAVGAPLILIFANPLGAALGAVLVEMVMAVWCRKAAGGDVGSQDSRGGGAKKEYSTMAMYSGLAWGQGQTDRLFVGFVAGSHTLGVLSLGVSLSRALGDAVASSNANLLRAELATSPAASSEHTAARVLRRGMMLAGAAALLTAAATKWALVPILASSWQPTLEIVPVLCLAVVPSVLSWTAGIYHVRLGTRSKALIGPAVSILAALPLATLSLLSLQALAIGIVLREFLLVLISYLAIGRHAPWRSLVEATAITATLGLATLTLTAL